MFLGFDLSTQQLKAVIIDDNLVSQNETVVSFDQDIPHYKTKKGVYVDGKRVVSPVAMWIEALDLLLQRLQASFDLSLIEGISGSGQQHGSVYWSHEAGHLLANLDPAVPLVSQLADALASPESPNWQDASTATECQEIEDCVGGPENLARITGSKAHHRFTGPQILRVRKLEPEVYAATDRISLVSSFLCSLLLGRIAPIDCSDVCGGNFWDIKAEQYHPELLQRIGGDAAELQRKLGDVCMDGAKQLGPIHPYFHKYGFSKTCQVVPFTGDNPATILALPILEQDAIISLGTSTTMLLSTATYVPDEGYHVFAHPITQGLHMTMLCYKNGSLARELVRDELGDDGTWENFNDAVSETKPGYETNRIGLYYPLHEIIPPIPAGTYHFDVTSHPVQVHRPNNAREILESQFLDIRMRSSVFYEQAETIYVVGGSSKNESIIQVLAEVLGSKGIYRQQSSNACAMGGANKAAYAIRRRENESFEEFVKARWKQDSIERLNDGYVPGVWESYGLLVPALKKCQDMVLLSTTAS